MKLSGIPLNLINLMPIEIGIIKNVGEYMKNLICKHMDFMKRFKRELEDNENSDHYFDFVRNSLSASSSDFSFALCGIDQFGFNILDFDSVQEMSKAFHKKFFLVAGDKLIDYCMIEYNISEIFKPFLKKGCAVDLATAMGFAGICDVGGYAYWYKHK